MKKYVLSLLAVALTVAYVLPAEAVGIFVNNNSTDINNKVFTSIKYYRNGHVGEGSSIVNGGGSIGWSNGAWVQLKNLSMIVDGGFKPVTCQGVNLDTYYYSDVNITINEDGTCKATVGQARS
ncbi:MAG TPA: hypothetical protein VLJ15_00485 [Gammaproteobacteria bacterium]|nr:hypothetical protein [Gammaproteobacteria bacterium]